MEYHAGEAVPSGSQYSIDTDGQPDAGGNFPFNEDWRLQMDMYVCVPWGNYELTVVSTSTNGGNAMERIAWEIEYGPDEVHRRRCEMDAVFFGFSQKRFRAKSLSPETSNRYSSVCTWLLLS